MATVDRQGSWVAPQRHRTFWTFNTSGDHVGKPQDGMASTRYIDARGTFGSAVVTLQGRNTASGNFVTLNTVTGGDATLSAEGGVEVAAIAREVRPRASGCTSTTDVTVAMISAW